MLATVINVILVLLGSALGLIFKNRISARFSSGLMFALGLCVLGIGISNMIRTNDTLCVIICMVLGTLLGEGLNIEKRMDGLGGVLRRKLIRGEGNNRFVEGFVTASLVVCVGAMAIVGSLQDALDHDPSTLFTKAILDFMIIMVFSSTYGRGAIFSALPVGVLQGSVTLFAGLLAPLLSGTVIDSLSFIGSLLIFCVGVNLAFGDRFRVANMLPALIFGGIWASLMG